MKDSRFQALFSDSRFAVDPTDPQFVSSSVFFFLLLFSSFFAAGCFLLFLHACEGIKTCDACQILLHSGVGPSLHSHLRIHHASSSCLVFVSPSNALYSIQSVQTNRRFKKTSAMDALMEERQKRLQSAAEQRADAVRARKKAALSSSSSAAVDAASSSKGPEISSLVQTVCVLLRSCSILSSHFHPSTAQGQRQACCFRNGRRIVCACSSKQEEEDGVNGSVLLDLSACVFFPQWVWRLESDERPESNKSE